MSRNHFILLFVVFLSLFLSSCGQSRITSTPINGFEATSTYSYIAIPDATATSTATISPMTSMPTKTSLPTATRTPRITKTLSPTPTYSMATLAVRATMDSIVDRHPDLKFFYSWECESVGLPASCHARGLGISPNGLWGAFFNVKGDSAGIKFIHIFDNNEWEIYFSEVTGDEPGDGTLALEHWSNDGRYVYVSPSVGCGGDEWFWRTYNTLIRLDLRTGRWIDTKKGPSFSFSPSEKYIAFRGINGVHIHEFRTGEERIFVIPSEFKQFGRFVWSPDDNRIIFVASTGRNDRDDGPNDLTILLIDLDMNTLEDLYATDDILPYPLSWSNPVYVEMGDFSVGPSNRTYYFFVLESKEIIPIIYEP